MVHLPPKWYHWFTPIEAFPIRAFSSSSTVLASVTVPSRNRSCSALLMPVLRERALAPGRIREEVDRPVSRWLNWPNQFLGNGLSIGEDLHLVPIRPGLISTYKTTSAGTPCKCVGRMAIMSMSLKSRDIDKLKPCNRHFKFGSDLQSDCSSDIKWEPWFAWGRPKLPFSHGSLLNPVFRGA